MSTLDIATICLAAALPAIWLVIFLVDLVRVWRRP